MLYTILMVYCAHTYAIFMVLAQQSVDFYIINIILTVSSPKLNTAFKQT